MADNYKVTLIGRTPLILHQDDVGWADQMDGWKLHPDNVKKSIPGDDRSPPFRWLGCLHHDGTNVALPSSMLRACLRDAAAQIPTGRGKKTFKAQSQSGTIIGDPYWPLLVNGKMIPVQPFFEGMERRTFDDYQKLAQAYGMILDVRRARIRMAKHIRVRPMLMEWRATGSLGVIDDELTEDVLLRILREAGRSKGLGDWRPGCSTPGTFGMFAVELEPTGSA